MLNDMAAQAITILSVRETGGRKDAINLSETLRECRIKTEAGFEELKVRIMVKVEAIGYRIDKDSFQGMDEEMEVGTVSAIVTTATPDPDRIP